jgi:hypothetical protein
MTCGRETSNVNRISLFARDSRELPEKRDERDGRRFEVRSSRFFELRTRNIELPVSFTLHERRGQRQAGC